ncbi:hypothetical protein N2152v2_000581 [Parachlorella kessleri]
MAGYAGPSITDLPGWRVGLLFLLFAAVAFAWHKGVKGLDRHLKRTGRRGLRKVLRALEDELLVLGLISLVLIAFERYLLLICIPCNGGKCYWDVEGPEADPADVEIVDETCSPGQEPVWSPAAIIQAHTLLFTIAAVHILYTTTVMLLCIWKMRQWRKYEEHSKGQWLQPIKYSTLPTPGGNPLLHFLRCVVSMFTQSVNADVYRALRRLFMERMGLDAEFDFHGFLVESMEEELASIISVDFILWAVVILWIMLPPESWVMAWMAGLAGAALLVVGVKLESIINQLTVNAYRKYGRQNSRRESPEGPLAALKESLARISPFRRIARASSPDGGKEGNGEEEGEVDARPAREAAGGGPDLEGEATGTTNTFSSGLTSSFAAVEMVQQTGDDPSQWQQKEQQQQQPQEQGLGPGRQQAATRAPAVLTGMERGSGQSAPEPPTPGNGPDLAIDMGRAGSSLNGLDSGEAQQGQQQDGGSDGQDPDPENLIQPTSVFRRCLHQILAPLHLHFFLRLCHTWWWPRPLRKKVAGEPATAEDAAAALEAAAADEPAEDEGLDAASLFWLGRPRIMLNVIQVVYFENSLALATFLFSLWQGVDFDWGRGQKSEWAIIVPLLVLDLALLVFSALFVLPVYAICTAAGSHCPESIIKHALKNPRLAPCARALQRMSAAGGPTPHVSPDPAGGEDRASNGEFEVVPGGPSGTYYGPGPPRAQEGEAAGLEAKSPGVPRVSPQAGYPDAAGIAGAAGAEQMAAMFGPGPEDLGDFGGDEDDGDGGNKSVTKLLGAMLASKTRQYMERASGGGPRPGSPPYLPQHAQQAQHARYMSRRSPGWYPESERATRSLPEEARLQLWRHSGQLAQQAQQQARMGRPPQREEAEGPGGGLPQSGARGPAGPLDTRPGGAQPQPSATNPARALDSRPSLAHVRELFDSFGRHGAPAVPGVQALPDHSDVPASTHAAPAASGAEAANGSSVPASTSAASAAASGCDDTDDGTPAAVNSCCGQTAAVRGPGSSGAADVPLHEGAPSARSREPLYRVSNQFVWFGETSMALLSN